MIITNAVFKKMDHNDPRYPDPDPKHGPATDVYLLTVDLQDGSQKECSHVFFNGRKITVHDLANILRNSAAGLDRMEDDKAA